MTNAEARFNKSLRPQIPEGSLAGRTAPAGRPRPSRLSHRQLSPELDRRSPINGHPYVGGKPGRVGSEGIRLEAAYEESLISQRLFSYTDQTGLNSVGRFPLNHGSDS